MFVQLLLVIVLLTYFAEKREANLVFSLYAICSTLEKTFQQIIPILKNKNQCVHRITKDYITVIMCSILVNS